MFFDKFLKIFQLILLGAFIITVGCNKKNADLDPDRPLSAKEKRRQNIDEGRGASLGGLIGKARGGTNYEFSSSNPMWRASLETLDFLPLTTVDYSGGVIITDWYSDNNGSKESLKITVRFLSNEIRSESIKIIIHKKNCVTSENCVTNLLSDNLIMNELRSTILRKASLFEKASKNKK
jgi:hypothetical protein|tara:strand:- start:376 stop:912 length:537 start_codon:yes stop_codon:yes gene_type:complete